MTRRVIAFIILVTVFVLTIFAVRSLKEFRIEASSDSLVLENDPAMGVYDRSRIVFGNDEYIFVTLTHSDIFSEESLLYLERLARKLEAVPGIASANSLTRLPLFRSKKSAPNLMQLMSGTAAFPTLVKKSESGELNLHPDVILEKAKAELTGHELFKGNLISEDGNTAAIVVTFEQDKDWQLAANAFFKLRAEFNVAVAEKKDKLRPELEEKRRIYRKLETQRKDQRVKIVADIRKTLKESPHKQGKTLASGLPSIIVDMVAAIQADLATFSWLSLAFISLFLGIVFQRLRWVILALTPCLITVSWVLSLFVLEDKRMTVVTCNIPALLLVVGLAHAIHFIVRFQEESRAHGANEDRQATITRTVKAIIKPCFYTALTTGIGFLSLVLADIRPVVDFGTHMSIGVTLAFVLSFLVLPSALLVWPAQARGRDRMKKSSSLLEWLAVKALYAKIPIAIVVLALLVFSFIGYQKVTAEASFVGYFRNGSPVRASLEHIDKKLGGTTQFEIVLSSRKKLFFASEEGFKQIEEAEKILQEYPEFVGNVVGLASVVKEADKIIRAAGLKFPKTAILQNFVPKLGKEQLASYVNADWTQARIVGRIHDTAENLNRVQFLEQIDSKLNNRVKVANARTGVFVLYTNMLKSLTDSQTETAAYVLLFIFIAIVILLRSVKFALVAMIPNVLPIFLVLGLMGWLGIPLDMATVMIASIALGIAIDGTIHYTVRFRAEYANSQSVEDAIKKTHSSIGVAIFYTTLTSIAGFWVLMFSHFNPNFYFGLFTGVAMLSSLFATLTLLPVCLAVVSSPKVEDSESQFEETSGDVKES